MFWSAFPWSAPCAGMKDRDTSPRVGVAGHFLAGGYILCDIFTRSFRELPGVAWGEQLRPNDKAISWRTSPLIGFPPWRHDSSLTRPWPSPHPSRSFRKCISPSPSDTFATLRTYYDITKSTRVSRRSSFNCVYIVLPVSASSVQSLGKDCLHCATWKQIIINDVILSFTYILAVYLYRRRWQFIVREGTNDWVELFNSLIQRHFAIIWLIHAITSTSNLRSRHKRWNHNFIR